MKKLTPILIVLTTLAVAGCNQNASQQTDKAGLCESAKALQENLALFNNLTPSSTVAEVRATEDKIQLAIDRLTGAEIVERAAEQKALKQAHDNLESTLDSLPPQDTIKEALTKLQGAATEVENARAKLAAGLQCS